MRPRFLFESYLVFIIILNILDFFEVLPTELDYIKKIISWTLLGYLLYKASPTIIMFGERQGRIDVLLIFGYFLLVIKNIISYAIVAVDTASLLTPFFHLLLAHYQAIEEVAFLLGILILTGIIVYTTITTTFHKRSIMGVLQELGKPKKKILSLTVRFLTTLLVVLAFFLFVFNLMMEWLAIAIDATLLLLALLFYTVLLARREVTTHTFIDRVANVGSKTYREFIEYFRDKKTFLLGVTGLLVLHVLTDIGNFIIPYITTLQDPLYFGVLGAGHDHIWLILGQDWLQATYFEKAFLIISFIANVIGYFILFLSPALIWLAVKDRKMPTLPKASLFYAALPMMVMTPLFLVTRLETNYVVGVDIQTTSMLTPYLGVGVGTGILLGLIGVFAKQKIMDLGWILSTIVFFGIYIWYFFIDVAAYYQELVISLLKSGEFIIGIVFFIFQGLTILFYVGGFGSFIYSLKDCKR